jgi:hypothetical protein
MLDADVPYCLLDRVRPGAAAMMAAVAAAVPADAQLYVIGGALRNSFVYKVLGKQLPQRDYDMVYVGAGRIVFADTLVNAGFRLGAIQRPDQQTFENPCVPDPKTLDDYFIPDVTFYDKGEITDILAAKTNFLLNGFAIAAADLPKPDWDSRVITLPGAMQSIEQQKVVLNPAQSPEYAHSNLFAAIRFVSQGFAPPSAEDVKAMLATIKDYPDEKFDKNVQKVFNYVGGEDAARAIAHNMGIAQDIFSRHN